MRKKALVLGIVILFSIIAISLFPFEIRSPLKSRESYSSYDFDKTTWLISFTQQYKEAQLNQANWVADPIALALRLAGYPNLDGINPDQVDIYYVNPTQLIVVIKSFGLMDDSVEAKDIRVDLAKKNEIWKIEWAGGRWYCRRTFFPGWSTSPCS